MGRDTTSALGGRVLRSPLTDRIYYCPSVEDLGEGRFRARGKKVDVTEDVKALVEDLFLEVYREPLLWFSRVMEERLKENDHKGGWADESTLDLWNALNQEAVELRTAISDDALGHNPAGSIPTAEAIVREAADVANFALFVADNQRKRLPGANADPRPLLGRRTDELREGK